MGARTEGALRPTRRWIAIGIAVTTVLAAAGIYWFGPQHLFQNRRVDEAVPSVVGGSTVLAAGTFASLAHETTGSASIIELEDGSRYVRFEDLDTLSGPDLRVYLSQAPADGPEDAFDDAFVDLGGLKANQGSQNYLIPSDVDDADLGRYLSVSIWCRRFSVGFGVAPLEAA